jgi:hypothetical protein
MLTQLIPWVLLAVLGCAAFAGLGIWAHETDHRHREHRLAMQLAAVPVPWPRTAESDELSREPEGAGIR